MKKRSIVLAAATGAFAAPLFLGLRRPDSPGATPTVTDVVAAARASRLREWALVEFAAELVRAQFLLYSARSPWESPARALRMRRGYSAQFNSVLAETLAHLGFGVRLVFAARVRSDENPWYHVGHVWVRVELDGRVMDLCALYGTRPGDVAFLPVTPVRDFRTLTRVDVAGAMCAVAAWFQWQRILLGRPLPRWLERPFGAPVGTVRPPRG